MDTRRGRGQWRFLDPVGAQLWTKTTAGTPVPEAIEELAAYWSSRGVDADTVRADLRAVADDLEAARLLTGAEQPPTVGVTVPTVRFASTGSVPLRQQIAGQAGLAFALVLLRCMPVRCAVAVARAVTRLPGRAATADEAAVAHTAVRRAARGWPGRAACLEESLGAHLAAALTGRRVRWVLGARFAPHGAHAWIEAEGVVIGQAETDRVWPYAAALQVERSN
ncbi:lasso peptide biosynthesis B2 protein [Streptomyces sp. G-G2]|uniref:lasso peptide biosynthesis B2 protein n=1 Tax=Streptomyces sp. G-G2 TaxID=3046201 RepID=UPI0024B9E56A|nr:lasso peptide biosynthesis B2 protein [Streptomyces sp. G-G2]MDJ0383235.1 lasso peptide biosynthesis B2 protein [Streptomyces sp. G-G2]